jgi:hypothetical protein
MMDKDAFFILFSKAALVIPHSNLFVIRLATHDLVIYSALLIVAD